MPAPATVTELAALMREAATDRRTVGLRGAGTKLGWGNLTPPVDLEVDTRRLDRIVEHAADDLVVTVEAGVTLEALQRVLAGSGQWLPLDPPEPGATVGGIVAAAASGPRRLRWGSPRDLLIGVTVVLADGTVARAGGKVVKNVAGYDLGRLFTGSFGTLGAIATCTFRLYPRPAATRAVVAEVDDVAAAVAAVTATRTEPSAVEWDGQRLTVVIEGSPRGAEARAAAVAAAVEGTVTETLPPGFGERPWREGPLRETDPVGLRITHRLGGLRQALAAVHRALPAARVRAHAGSGVIWVGYAGDLAPVDDLRREVAALDGQVVVVEAPPAAKQGIDVWGPVRGLAVMRAIKDQFDPEHRLAPGRFAGGI